MSYFIIIRGPAGIGKTTIGKKLSKILNAKFISVDRIMKENNWRYIPGEECITKERYLKANKIIIPEIKKILKKGNIVIIENNFYHKIQIEDIIKNIKEKYYIFNLKASQNTCLIRNKNREKPLKDNDILAVHKLTSRFEYGINIDTDNKTEDEVMNEILNIIKEK